MYNLSKHLILFVVFYLLMNNIINLFH